MALSGLLAVLILLGTLSTDTSNSAQVSPSTGYLGCVDYISNDRNIKLVNPAVYSPDHLTEVGCAELCSHEVYSHFGLREHNKVCFCGNLENGTDFSSICTSQCTSTTEIECEEDINRMSLYEAATPPLVWIQELEPGAGIFTSDNAIFTNVEFKEGYFPPWEKLTFTIGVDLGVLSNLNESVNYKMDFGDGSYNAIEGSTFYHKYSSTGNYRVVISVLSEEKATIVSKSYDIKISLPLKLYGQTTVTANCPKDAAENDTLSCVATVPSGTGLSAIVNFGSAALVESFSFSDTKSSYFGASWDSETSFSDVGGEDVPTEYMKIWQPVEDTRALLVAYDVEIKTPGNVNIVVRKKVEAEEPLDDCLIIEESAAGHDGDDERDTNGTIRCVESERYSFAKRACVHVSSPGSPQLDPSWERLTYPQTFDSPGTHRVFFNEPVWLNKGDVLGVQIFEGAIAKVASSKTPDCGLASGSTTCVYNGVEVCVGFVTLRSSRVMVQKTRPPSLAQETLTTLWLFYSDLDDVTVLDTFEYMLPISNVNVTGEDKAIVSEIYTYQLTFDGNADTIIWSFGDGEEVQTSKCELNITKRWWLVGDLGLTVTVSNKASSVKFILPVRVGLIPHVHFLEWVTTAKRGEVAHMEFRNGYFAMNGRLRSSDYLLITTCYVSTSVDGSTTIEMKSVDDGVVWVPTTNLWGQYIKFFFDEEVYLSAVLTKGHPDRDEWVEEFIMFYHIRGGSWYPLLQLDGSNIFYGNFDRDTVVKNTFATIYTDGIKLEPTKWHNNIAMRWEVVGEYQFGIRDELSINGHRIGLNVSDDDRNKFLDEYSLWEGTFRNVSLWKDGRRGEVSYYSNEASHYWIEITASNLWGEVNIGTTLYVQDPIVVSKNMLSKHVFSSSENVTLNLTLDSGDSVEVNTITLDGDVITSACEDWNPERRQILCSFQPGVDLQAIGNHSVVVELENRISGVVILEETFFIMEEVGGLTFNVSNTEVDIGQVVVFSYELLQGTNVTVRVSGLDDTLEFYHACASCGSTLHTFEFQFSVTESISITLTAENLLNSLTDEVSVHVVGNIRNVLLSYESLIEKQPLGYGIAALNFTFNGSFSEIPHDVQISCDFNGILPRGSTQPVLNPHDTISVSFMEAGTQELTCEIENPTSTKTFHGIMEVEEPISGLSLTVNPINITMLESVFIYASVATGSRVYYDISFGDGESDVFSPANPPTHVEHVYRKWGNFLVQVTARNELAMSEPVDQIVIVSTPTEGCVLFKDDFYLALPAGDSHMSFSLDLYVPYNLPVPDFAEYALYVNDSFFLGGFLNPPPSDSKDSETLKWVTSFEIQTSSVGLARIVVDIDKSSEHYFQTCFWDAFIVEEVSGITSEIFYAPSTQSLSDAVGNSSWLPAHINPFGNRPVTKISSPVRIEMVTSSGSSLSYVWSFELLDSEESTCEAGEEAGRVCHFLFHNDRDFTFSVNITNQVSTISLEQDLSIFKPVGSVTIEGPTSIVRVYKNVPFVITVDSLGSESCIRFIVNSSFAIVEVEAYYGELFICEMLFPDKTSGSQTYQGPNDFIETVDESGTTFRFVHNFTVPNTYDLQVTGKNLLSQVDTIYHQNVLEPACYQPTVDVAKENLCDRNSNCNLDNSTKLFAASDMVMIYSRVRLNCSSSYLALYTWKVFLISVDGNEVEYTLPDGVVTSGYTLGTLTIPPTTLRYGSYRVELNVTMEGAEDAANGDFTYIEIDSSPLVAKIAGGDFRTIPWSSVSILDGITNSYDPDVGKEDKSGLMFHWLCRRKTYHPEDGPPIENVETFETWSYDFTSKLSEGTVNPEFTELTEADVGGCFGRFGGEGVPLPGGLLNTTDGYIEVDTSSMFESMEYEFKLIVRNEFFQAEFYQTWHVLSSDIPTIAIGCLENCGERINPTNRLALQGMLDGNLQLIPYFKWELYHLVDNFHELIPETFWSNFSTTGGNSPAVTFLPGVFQEGEIYIIFMYSSWGIDFHRKAMATYQISVNEPPRPWSCDVTAYEGVALLDQFSVFCFGWEDVDIPLTYTFRTRAQGTLDWHVFHSSTKAYMEPTTFQAGLEEYDFNIEVQITVHDKLGSSTVYDLIIIKVTPGPSIDSQEAAEVIGSLQEELIESASNGDTSMAANIAINIIDVLNTKSAFEAASTVNLNLGSTDNENNPNNEESDSLDFHTRISIRTQVVNWLAESDNPTVEAIDQSATVLAGAIKVPDEVTEEVQEKAVSVAIRYSNILLELAKEESTVDESLKTATNRVLQLANNVVLSAMVKINKTFVKIEEATSVDIYEEDFDEALKEPEEENKIILEEAETTKSKATADIEKALAVVADIQSIMEQALVPDEAPSKVEAEGITVTCSKARPLSNRTNEIKTQINENCSVTLPLVDNLMADGFNVSSATVWVLEMALFDFNIKPEDEVAKMTGHSLSVKMRDYLSGEPLKMKNLSDSFRLSIPQREESIRYNNEIMQTYSNESNPKGATIAVHTIYVPWSNALNLEFEAGAFEEMELGVVYNFTFHILLKQRDAPSFYDFDLECLLQQQIQLTEEPPKNRKKTHKFKVATTGEKACFFDNDDLDILRDGNRSAVNFRVGVSHTFMTSTPPQETEEAARKLNLTSIRYNLRPHLSKCYFSSEGGKSWKSVGCKVLPTSSVSQTDCACNHLTVFGSGFQIPINKIDLSDSAFTKLDENPVVFTFLLACLCIYSVIIVWARKKDMRDLEKTGVTPLPDNDPRDKFMYEVTVYTGFKGKAGTTANVSLNIAGDKAETGARPFLDPKRKVFQVGGIDTFLLASPEALGELQFLRVWHDNSGNDASWFLSRVSVKDLKTEKVYYFIVDQWLAVEEDDGKIERVCPVAGKSELTSFGFLFYSKSRKNLSDGHLWFSIFARPYKSNFTRVQRTTCCLSLLFTTMMANIFFYNVELVNGNQTELFKMGPVTLTVGEVIIGCISSLMVFPINLIVVNIFRSVKPPPKNHGIIRWIKRKLRKRKVSNLYSKEIPVSKTRPVSATSVKAWLNDSKLAQQELERERDILEGVVKTPVYSISGKLDDPNSEDVLGGDHRLEFEPVAGFKRSGRKKKKKRFLLPWYFVYLGWFLVIASVFASFFLTVEVAGQFGREKSMEWLLSIGVSLVQDIFLAQPIKVLLLAIFFSLIVKKPEEEELSNDERTISQLRDDEEYMHERMTLEELNNPSKLAHLSDIKRRRITMTELPTYDDLEQSRNMRLKEMKMRKVLMEIVFYVIFLNVIIIISFGGRDFNSFWINKSMQNMFVDAKYHGKMKFTMVRNRTGFWNWTDHTLIPSLYSLSWYNGDPDLPGRDQHHTADQTLSMIGTPRFRQVRILKDHCSVPDAMRKKVTECKDMYSMGGNDAGIYNESWEDPMTDVSDLNLKSYPQSVWAYQDWISLKSIPYPGYHGVYAGGGYIAELGKTPRESWRVTRYLKEKTWVDQYTRAVFIEFVVYNPSVNLFCASFLIMEFLPQGGAAGYVYFIPMKLDRYHSSVAYFILAGEIVYVCFILYFMFREIYNIRKEKAAYFKSVWNLLEILTIVLALLGLICYFCQLFLSRDLLTQYREQPKRFLNFQYVSTWAEFNNWFLSGVLFIATLKFLRLLRFNRRLQLLALTFKGSGKEIVAYTVVFGIVFMAYASAAYLLFSVGLADFSTMVRTVESLFATIMGKFDFHGMSTFQRFFGPLFFFTFVMLMIFILMSMFLSIINAAFRKVRIDNEMEENELEIVNFIMSRFLTWTGFSQRRMRHKARNKSRYIEGVDSVAEECDHMKVKLNEMIVRLQKFVVQERREQFGLRGDEGKARRIFFT